MSVWTARSNNWLPYPHHLILIIARQNWLPPSSTWRMVPLSRGRGAPAPVETLLSPNSCLQLTAAQLKAFKVCSLFSLGCMGMALGRLTCCGLCWAMEMRAEQASPSPQCSQTLAIKLLLFSLPSAALGANDKLKFPELSQQMPIQNHLDNP